MVSRSVHSKTFASVLAPMALESIGIESPFSAESDDICWGWAAVDRPRHTVLTFVRPQVTMARMRYVVTGGTGFIGRRLVSQILDRSDDAEVWVLVRRESLSRFERLATEGDKAWGDRAK